MERTKPYNPKGRYETEEQARQIDIDMRDFLRNELGVSYHVCGTTDIQPILDLITNGGERIDSPFAGYAGDPPGTVGGSDF